MIVPKNKAFGWVLLIGLGVLLLLADPKYSPIAWVLGVLFPSPQLPPYISHVVLFQFKPGTAPVAVKEVTSKMFGLKKSCIHPSTGNRYIQSITGGKDISTEALQNGMTHAFILRFQTKEHRDYYLSEDPVHRAFRETASTVLERVQVIDFQEGVFH
ncbi:hypothetical protein EJ04DRAFT_424059 [Polyplosphaeria fusca]|uniref:Stress-response A/B barrel domain-containing protein n=1 Tax=Polyplosphaeria fusca TaxID=682080 RepID=A0A9P4V905_9PLEO|nr:hypothetical protein EJ04DRAFT_424059 [Polyplosphaeria fusca]